MPPPSPLPSCPVSPIPWEEGVREGSAQHPWDNGECYTEKSPNPRAGLRWAQPAGQGPLLRCCRGNIPPWKRLVMPFPLLKQNPVKPGWFGAGLRQLPSGTGLGKGHLGGIQGRESPPSFPSQLGTPGPRRPAEPSPEHLHGAEGSRDGG